MSHYKKKLGISFAIFSASFSTITCAADLSFDDLHLTETPLISPTRLKQPLRDVPASVTVIDERTITALGFTEIADVLRLVPGMAVGQASGNDYRINYHGGSGLVPRRMQVLIDGMPIYQSGYAKVDWKSIGISIHDVSRVEVTRSPSSASYGANAFSAVINIVTKAPALSQGVEFAQTYSTRDAHESYARYGSMIGNTTYRVSASSRGDSGFDKNAAGNDRRDGSDFKLVNLSTHTTFDRSSLDIRAGATNGEMQIEFADRGQQSFPDAAVHNWYLDSVWEGTTSINNSVKLTANYKHDSINQNWHSCYALFLETDAMRELALSNPDYALSIVNRRPRPPGGTAHDLILYNAALAKIASMGASALSTECGSINQDATDDSLVTEIQDTYIISDGLRVLGGLGNRHNRFVSDTYVNGSLSNNDTYAFVSADFIADPFVLNVGTMAEYQSDYTDGVEYSPRVALNYRIDDKQTLKFIVSRAIRTPDALENDRDWSYYVSNFTVPFDGKTSGYFFYRALSTEQLKSEKIESQEISYLGNFPEYGITLDLKIYREDLDDLISEKLQFLDYHPTNDGWIDNRGAEVEIHYTPNPYWLFGLTYAYQDSDSNNDYEQMLTARNSGSVFAIWSITPTIRLNAAYFSSSSISGFPYDRLDLGISKSWGTHVSTFARVSRLAEQSGFMVDQRSQVLNRYNSLYEGTFGIKFSY